MLEYIHENQRVLLTGGYCGLPQGRQKLAAADRLGNKCNSFTFVAFFTQVADSCSVSTDKAENRKEI